MNDRSDVVGIIQSAYRDQSWEHRVEVVVIRFGVSQLGRQRAVGVGVEHVTDLLGREAGRGKQGGPSVVLGSSGERDPARWA